MTPVRLDVLFGFHVIQLRPTALSYAALVPDDPLMRCLYCGRVERASTGDQCQGCGAWRKEAHL